MTDYGLVYYPGTKANRFLPSEQGDAVDGVRFLQMQGRFLAGSADTEMSKHFGQPGAPVDRFFAIDTGTHQRTDFRSQQELGSWMTAHGFQLKLEPIAEFYVRYRWTWFDGFAAALLLLPPMCGLGLLYRAVLRARRPQQPQPNSI